MRHKIYRGLSQAIFIAAIFTQERPTDAQSSPIDSYRFGSPASGARAVVGIQNQNCSTCHFHSGPKSDVELPPDLRSAGNDGWILGDELFTWSQQDHHYNAFAVLKNEQSRQIARLMGIVDEAGNSLVHRDRRCLSCHSSIPVTQMDLTGDLVNVDTLLDPRYTIGVSCEACHGPAGQSLAGAQGWGSAHFASVESQGSSFRWRLLSSAEKFDKFGYWDVRSPETQARICLSCHYGNVEQKKVITHEMYAVGHPPLPGFELSQFVRQMPPHWRRFDEKPEIVREAFLKDRRAILKLTDDPEMKSANDDHSITKSTLISSMVALEVAMRFTADSLDEPDAGRHPELANYSCFACHHELIRDGWRKSRRSTSPPGRPTLHEWPVTLANVVENTFGLGEDATNEFQAKYAAVAEALNAQPFGKTNQLRQATLELANVAAQYSHRLANVPIDHSRSTQLLKNLAKYGATHDVDYDSARQLIWAYERILTDRMQRTPNDGTRHPIFQDDDIQFAQAPDLIRFEKSLLLWLRSNRNEPNEVNKPSRRETYPHAERTINIGNSLERISRYNPAEVRTLFQHLLEQLERGD
jgi:hypothetical protein